MNIIPEVHSKMESSSFLSTLNLYNSNNNNISNNSPSNLL